MLQIVTGAGALEVADFQARYDVSDKDLGRWMRAAVEEALDRAAAAVKNAP